MIMEADTYRYHGHSMSDPGSTYRTRDEISSMRQLRDPVEHVRKLLTDNNLMDTAELKKLEKVSPSLSHETTSTMHWPVLVSQPSSHLLQGSEGCRLCF